MTSIGGFEIKREEKYFVFRWMSRKERAVAEKMAHHSLFSKRWLQRRRYMTLGRKPYLGR
jgi:hypothetical protein